MNVNSSVLAPHKPPLSFWQIWNMCFGFLGLQFGFALQNANVSRIFQALGASIDQIPILWVAAPLTGLLVQPLVGYLSDRTWTRLGRRRPYFLVGAVLAAITLFFMPQATSLWIAVCLLWLLDASINVSMEPFRALVGDQLAPAQRPAGYAMQSFFIGIGAVVASMLPWLLAHLGVDNHVLPSLVTSSSSVIPDTVRYSFYAGAVVVFAAVGWTVFRTREYAPEALRTFADATPLQTSAVVAQISNRSRFQGFLWSGAGLSGLLIVRFAGLDPQLYLLCGGTLLWGLALLVHRLYEGTGDDTGRDGTGMFTTIMRDLESMPAAMRRLAPVQFFSWLALFSMWIYTTAAVTQVHFKTLDPLSETYNQGANWVGVLFAAYNGFAALAAAVIPFMVRRLGLRLSHLINLWLGGVALLSFQLIRDPNWLLLPMLGVGFAWASILSLPYALLSDNVPAQKMGLYMGIFNFFIVIPQLVAASVLGVLLKLLFNGAPIYALMVGGLSFIVAGTLVMRVAKPTAELRR